MEKFGKQPPKAPPSASRSQVKPQEQAKPQESELSALGKKMLFFRSLNNRAKSPQVASTTPVAPAVQVKNSVELAESVSPQVHVAPAHVVAAGVESRALVVSSKLPFPLTDSQGAAVAASADPTNQQMPATQELLADQNPGAQQLNNGQLADVNQVSPEVVVSTNVPTNFKLESQSTPSALVAQDLSISNDPQIMQATRSASETELDQNNLIDALAVGPAPAPIQTEQLATNLAPATVQPVLGDEFGVFGEMDGQRSIGQNSIALRDLAQRDTNQISEGTDGQIKLEPLQPAVDPQTGTAHLVSTRETSQDNQTVASNLAKQANSLVLLPATLRQQAAPENIKVLPLDRQPTASKPLTTAKVYSTESMVGPLPNAGSLLTQLDFENDFRNQAAVPVSMVRTTSDASGFGPEWMQQNYAWVAPTFPHKPLYFEQPNLERYGRGAKRCIQPLHSGAHFFGSILLMPYKVLTQHPEERVYPLGNNRPGDVVPYQTRTLLGQSYPFEALRYFEPYSDYK